MISCSASSVANITYDLSGLYLLAGGDADAGAMGVQRFLPAAVVDLDVVAVTAAPAVKTVGNGDDAVCGGEDRCSLGAGNVGAGVGADLAGDGVYAMSELRGNRSRNRQRPLQGACRGSGAVRRHDLSPALCKAAEQFLPQFFILRVLQQLQGKRSIFVRIIINSTL